MEIQSTIQDMKNNSNRQHNTSSKHSNRTTRIGNLENTANKTLQGMTYHNNTESGSEC